MARGTRAGSGTYIGVTLGGFGLFRKGNRRQACRPRSLYEPASLRERVRPPSISSNTTKATSPAVVE